MKIIKVDNHIIIIPHFTYPGGAFSSRPALDRTRADGCPYPTKESLSTIRFDSELRSGQWQSTGKVNQIDDGKEKKQRGHRNQGESSKAKPTNQSPDGQNNALDHLAPHFVYYSSLHLSTRQMNMGTCWSELLSSSRLWNPLAFLAYWEASWSCVKRLLLYLVPLLLLTSHPPINQRHLPEPEYWINTT